MAFILFPFTKKGTKTLLHSWILSQKQGADLELTRDALEGLSKILGCHPVTLKRQLNTLTDCYHYLILKTRSGFFIKRTGARNLCKGVHLSTEIHQSSGLSPSEKVLLGALTYYTLAKKKIPARYKLAMTTGFSLRQVTYALKSLTQKGWLKSTLQEEDYVRVSRFHGRIEDTRERRVHTLNPKKISSTQNKIAPLKEYNINPVNNVFKIKSEWSKILKYFETKTGTKSTLLFPPKVFRKNFSEKTVRGIYETIDKILTTPFLKLALKFGWQEAVVESYHRQRKEIWVNSRHIDKYTHQKLDLGWVLKRI